MRHFYGVDPGKEGALAVLDEHGRLLAAFPVPVVDDKGRAVLSHHARGTYDLKAIRTLLTKYPDPVVTVETVPAMPRPGRFAGAGRGESTFAWMVAGISAEIPCYTVTPQQWQRVMLAKDLARRRNAKDKSASIRAAQALWPKADLRRSPRAKGLSGDVCEAALIAECGRRKHLGLTVEKTPPTRAAAADTALDVTSRLKRLQAIEAVARKAKDPTLRKALLQKLASFRTLLEQILQDQRARGGKKTTAARTAKRRTT